MSEVTTEGLCYASQVALEEIEQAMRSTRSATVPPSVARKIDGMQPTAHPFCMQCPSSHLDLAKSSGRSEVRVCCVRSSLYQGKIGIRHCA
jgi:molybdenum cofactor biosynthesis enzyme MoaA